MKDIKLKDVEMPEDLLSSIRTDVFWTNRQSVGALPPL